MVQGRSTEIISMIKWIRTSWLSTKNSLSGGGRVHALLSVPATRRRHIPRVRDIANPYRGTSLIGKRPPA